ncbi:DNA-binding death effector domain-containing protein 2 [Malaclemys terrapin pileata]|uniref:DNA-binding death effector domain-containing protein 2 n=1 Tax=Malaclemys terrapin pileata TaxID=2991368 RepID=UPI0023A82476|nr:DNA-binding death effector domain-containing protein 2 [Malaclemys terrapin pileata]
MAEMKRPVVSHPWEEEECLEYYGMVSLHHMFEVIGSQLTENDVAVLSFLLDETQPWTHPLDPRLWAVVEEDGAETPSPLLESWQRRSRRWQAPVEATGSLELVGERHQPRNGVELLLELERRGRCDETNFLQLLQLLRLLTRHDLLPYVTLKRQRTVSPERYTYGPSVTASDRQMDSCLGSASAETQPEQWETGSSSSKRKRVSRGRARASALGRRRGAKTVPALKQEPPSPTKVTCDIRLRVRAEFCQHEPVLRQNVLSNKQHRLERQFDIFGQSNTILKSRDLGSIICDIKFSELSYLDAFWSDYMNGSLLEALKGVFLTESLKDAVGQEAIRLLVNVDEDDYEEGRRLLLDSLGPQ